MPVHCHRVAVAAGLRYAKYAVTAKNVQKWLPLACYQARKWNSSVPVMADSAW